MAINGPTKQDRANTYKQWRAHLRTVAIVLILEGILFGAWAMTRPEPPQWILLEEHHSLKVAFQEELEEEKKKTREAKQQTQTQIRLKEARYANLQRKHEDLSKALALAIRTDRLPRQVQASTGPQTLKNIETVWPRACAREPDQRRRPAGRVGGDSAAWHDQHRLGRQAVVPSISV